MRPNPHVWPARSPATLVAGRESPAHARNQGGFCNPGPWVHEIAEWVLGDVTDYVNVSNGFLHWYNFTDITNGATLTSVPAGNYVVLYCTGAWLDAPGSWAVAKEDPSQVQLNGGNRITVQYQNGGVATQAHFDEANVVYPTYAAACAGASGSATAVFAHSGGALQIGFADLSTGDNGNAQSSNPAWTNPRYMLAQLQPWFTSGNCHANFTQTSSPRWTGHFDISNNSPYAWTNITIKMRSGAGITNPGSVTVDYSAMQNQALALTFDSAGPCDPILDVYWNDYSTTEPWQSFQFHLAPLIVYTGSNNSRGSTACGTAIHLYAGFTNSGNMDTTPDCQFAARPLSGWSGPMQPPGCVPGAVDYITVQLCCGGWTYSGCDHGPYGARWDYYFHDQNPIPPATIEFLVTDGTTVLLDQTASV